MDGEIEDFHRILPRLSEVPGYKWDLSIAPFHTTYDYWHFIGTQDVIEQDDGTSSASLKRSGGSSGSERPALSRSQNSSKSDNTTTTTATGGSSQIAKTTTRTVVARVTRNILRLEREFQTYQGLATLPKAASKHFLRPIQIFALPVLEEKRTFLVAIYESPGANYLRNIIYLGPNFYKGKIVKDGWKIDGSSEKTKEIPLMAFLDFAIGAAKCCEILHHDRGMVHGELRGDSFHMHPDTGLVKMVTVGSGTMSFEKAFTSHGWANISKERGSQFKLQFISPEQTGRVPAEPDARTDIYSLGVVFWTMLLNEPPLSGDSPLEILQSVLSRRIPLLSSRRLDIPDSLSKIIAKMTEKNIEERYHSSSGLKYDLLQVRKLLSEGKSEELQLYEIATKDISCFFSLPRHQIGRAKEKQILHNVIEKVSSQSRAKWSMKNSICDASSASTVSDIRNENKRHNPDHVSAATNSPRVGGVLSQDHSRTNLSHLPSHESLSSLRERAENGTSTTGSFANTANSIDMPTYLEKYPSKTIADDYLLRPHSHISGSESLGSSLGTAYKWRHKGNCEVVSIVGAAGLGKSSLIQSTQMNARHYGYFAYSRFEQLKRAPFSPVLKLMSSLFHQIFSETDTDSGFHNRIREMLRPAWGTLHTYLGLPERLLDPVNNAAYEVLQSKTKGGTRHESKQKKACRSPNVFSTNSVEWLRSGGSAKSSRFMTTFIDVLRVLACEQFICFCIDDLQFANEESLELIRNIISGRLSMLLVVSYKRDDDLPESLKHILSASATKIHLSPFNEEEIAQYISLTLHRPTDYVLPFATIVKERTGGNPLYIREMLERCHNTKSIYFSRKESEWQYDLDRIIQDFSSENVESQPSNGFILGRLKQLPKAARTFLSSASFIGFTFSFKMTKDLMIKHAQTQSDAEDTRSKYAKDAVQGLQSALSAFVIISTDEDDVFQFTHERYLRATRLLAESCDKIEMHYLVAEYMVKERENGELANIESLYELCGHVCSATSLIKKRVQSRKAFRDALSEAAENASESGAQSSALSYYETCLELLQSGSWDDGAQDKDYQETLMLYTKAAQAYLYAGDFEKAMSTVSNSFANAKDIVDKAPFFVIAARILVSQGKSVAAFEMLKTCLTELGLDLSTTSWAHCDEDFAQLRQRLERSNIDLFIVNPVSTDSRTMALGSTIVEVLSTAFWSDSLLLYQLTLRLLQISVDGVNIPHAVLGYIHFAWIAIGRFGLVDFGITVGLAAQKYLDIYLDDAYVVGMGQTLLTLFMGHLQTHLRDQLVILDRARDSSVQTGDQILSMLNYGVMATIQTWSGEDLTNVESFLDEISAGFLSSSYDMRGEIFPVSVRQYVKALQGKTGYKSADTVMSDDSHDSEVYIEKINGTSSNTDRLMSIYSSYEVAALYRYGHFEEVLLTGKRLVTLHQELWCMPHRYFNLCYLSLSSIALIRANPSRNDRDDLLHQVKEHMKTVQTLVGHNDVNYRHWLLLLEAEILDLNEDYTEAVETYESAVDHAELHEFTLDLAMIFELYSAALVRHGAERPARRLIQDCISLYRRISAFGKAGQVSAKYDWLLNTFNKPVTSEAACQTDFEPNYRSWDLEQNERQNEQRYGKQSSAERTEAWLLPGNTAAEKIIDTPFGNIGSLSAVNLDVIDLASILESTQVMSSELQVDILLAKMTGIILESTSADLGAIVVEDEQLGWAIRAIGTPEGVTGYPDGQSLDTVEDQVAKQITNYVLRLREPVVVHNLLQDERFANVSDVYLRNNPGGRAIIAIPIMHGDGVMLGSIHVEGPPNSFTERSITVLRLLVNQISISLANALMFKRLKRVSASNKAMVEMQKRALEQTQQSEKNAKESEANAIRNMKVAKEATKAKSLFLANVSHELRTPLNGVLGMSELLRSSKLNVDQESYADSIRVCADTLLNIINDLLDYSKLEANKMKMFFVPFSLAETISEVVRALSYANMGKDVETTEEVEISKEMLVLGDPVRLHQIFMNLLSNSYKFTPSGKVIVRAKVEKETKDYIDVTCSVSDTGIGISEEQKKRLFIPFSQADNSTARNFGGTGLGLSICKAIVDVMKGKIWLDSAPNSGTVVSFSLRLKKVTKGQGVAAKNKFSGSAPTSSDDKDLMKSRYGDPSQPDHTTDGGEGRDISMVPRHDIRICIAEDNPINQKIAVSFVRKMGLACDVFGDGRQAVQALEKAAKEDRPYHLVLMDVQMPVLDGYHATREIRKSADEMVKDVLVIAMTASAIRGDREKCLEAGMNNYLAKPVRSQTLKAVLDTYLAPIDTPSSANSRSPEPAPTTITAPDAKPLADRRKSSTSPAQNAQSSSTGNGNTPLSAPSNESEAEEKGDAKSSLLATKSTTASTDKGTGNNNAPGIEDSSNEGSGDSAADGRAAGARPQPSRQQTVVKTGEPPA